MAEQTASFLFAYENLNLVDEIHVSQKVGATALVNLEGVHYLLLSRGGDLGAIEIDSLGCCVALQPGQLFLVAAPLVSERLTTFETAHRNNHGGLLLGLGKVVGAILGGRDTLASCPPVSSEVLRVRSGRALNNPGVLQKCPLLV